VHADLDAAGSRLEAAPLGLVPPGQRAAEKALPEPARPPEVVGGELDQGELGHAAIVAPR
jgi:hypothetical protein